MTGQFLGRSQQKAKSYGSRALNVLQLWNDSRRAARHDDSLFIWIPKNRGRGVGRKERARAERICEEALRPSVMQNDSLRFRYLAYRRA